MFEQRLAIKEGQRLTLVEMRNVDLAAGEEGELLIRLREGDAGDVTVEETEAGPSVSARVACEIRVPREMPVTIREVKGELHVREVASVNAEQVRGNLKLVEAQEAVIAEVYGNLKAEDCRSLRVVGTVYGNATLKDVEEGDVQNVRGNAQGKNVGRLRLTRTGGNLAVKDTPGPLEVDQVGGNAALKRIAGAVTMRQVAGSLAVQDLTGGARFERVGGSLAATGEVGQGVSYHFGIDGNAVLSLPEGTQAHVTLIAGGQIISSAKLTDVQREEDRLSGTLGGGGGAEIFVDAGGNAFLSTRYGDRSEIGDEIAREVHEALRAVDLEAIGRKVEESLRDVDLDGISRRMSEEMQEALSRLRVKLDSVDWDQVGTRTQKATERAMERLEREMERMTERAARHQHTERELQRHERELHRQERELRRRERLERRMEEVRRAQESVARTAPVDAPGAVGEEPAGVEAATPNLDEERLSILQMVERGQISPEEAEMLLDALE